MTRLTAFDISRNKLDSFVLAASKRQSWRVWTGFLAVLVFAWFCYQPAVSGAFQFDDYANLRSLAKVEDLHSALDFIFSGIAGPTGRPLALASFALQADQWEQGASAFLHVNIFIHLLNASLLALCLYQLCLQRSVDREKSEIIAVATASLWTLMPLLAIATLQVVQRMTTLSATFMLLGLFGYLLARARLNNRPMQALILMSVSLFAGTVLATLTKESGALLPAFILVLEATVLQRPANIATRIWSTWKLVFLVLPILLLLIYLASWFDYPEHLLAHRDFNAWERLLTETRVLWIYLAKALLGIPSKLGIYQYPPAVSRSLFDPTAFAAGLAWCVLFVAAIRWRRRYPLFAVAVLWYLAGHLIESTVVGLELYFEHRNYMPIIGPLFALSSCLVLHPKPRWRRFAAVLVSVLAIVNAWFLYSFATLSGDPGLAARFWAKNYPESPRTVLRMATYRLAEEGPEPALKSIESFVSTYPEHSYLRIPQLNLLCQYVPGKDHRPILEHLERQLPTVDYSNTTNGALSELLKTVEKAPCNGVDSATVVKLASTLMNNPRYAIQPVFNQYYYKTLAYVAWRHKDYGAAIEHLRTATEHGQLSDVNVMMVTALGVSGNFDAARQFIDDAEAAGPKNPLKALIWRRDLDRLRKYIHNMEAKGTEAAEGLGHLEFDTENS